MWLVKMPLGINSPLLQQFVLAHHLHAQRLSGYEISSDLVLLFHCKLLFKFPVYLAPIKAINIKPVIQSLKFFPIIPPDLFQIRVTYDRLQAFQDKER
jgi:hypothetical protein